MTAGRVVAAALAALGLLACTATPPTVVPGPTTSRGPQQSGPTGTALPAESVIAPTTACELIYEDEAAAILGVPIGDAGQSEAMSDGSTWASDCIYRRQAGSEIAPIRLSLGSGSEYQDEFASLKSQSDVQPVADLGDEALLKLNTVWGLGSPVATLFVRAANAVFSISLGVVDVSVDGVPMTAGDSAAQGGLLTSLARIALGRLVAPPVEAPATCTLVSVVDAASATGLPIGAAEDVDGRDVWGPGCQYKSADGALQLFVAVNSRPTARANFTSCADASEPIAGLGMDAFLSPRCFLLTNSRPVNRLVMVRSSDTVVTVGQADDSEFDGPAATQAKSALARLVLGRLGLASNTPPPQTPGPPSAYLHPCTVASLAEVSEIVRQPVALVQEQAAGEIEPIARCLYLMPDQQSPLILKVGFGPDAVAAFNSDKSVQGVAPVDGLLYEAFVEQWDTAQGVPLLRLNVLADETVLRFELGRVSAPDGSSPVALGNDEVQLKMVKALARLALMHIFGPLAFPSDGPDVTAAALALHVVAKYPGGGFEADGQCEFGPLKSWMYLHYQRAGGPEEYMTVGPAPNGVGGSPPTGGAVMGADSVRIAVFDQAAGAVAFVDDPRAILNADLLGGTFNGVWKAGTASIDLIYTCT